MARDASLFLFFSLPLIYVTIKIFSGCVNWDLGAGCGNLWVTRAEVGRGFISALGSKQLLWIGSHIRVIAFMQEERKNQVKNLVLSSAIIELNRWVLDNLIQFLSFVQLVTIEHIYISNRLLMKIDFGNCFLRLFRLLCWFGPTGDYFPLSFRPTLGARGRIFVARRLFCLVCFPTKSD